MRGITVILAIAVCLAAVVASTDGRGLCLSSEQLSSLLKLKQLKEKVCEQVNDELTRIIKEVSFPREEVDNIVIDSIQLQRLVASADDCDVKVNGRTIKITLRRVRFDMTGLWKNLADNNARNKRVEVDVSRAKIIITLKTKTEECTIQDIQALDCDLVLKPRHMTISNGPNLRNFDDHLIGTAEEQVHEVCGTDKALKELRRAAEGFLNIGR